MLDSDDATAWQRHSLGARAAGWVDAAYEPVTCVDLDHRIVYLNPAFERFAGVASHHAIGRRLAEIVSFDAAAGLDTLIDRVGATGQRHEGEFGADRDDGRWTWAVSVRPDRDDTGSLVGYIVAVRDVTQHRRTEQALRERDTDFRTLADNSPDNIIRFGLDGRATYCNQEIERRVGVSPTRIVGRRLTESVSADHEQMVEYERQVMRALQTGEPGRVELVVHLPSGEERTHSILIRAEQDVTGAVVGAIAIGRDITDLVVAQQALADKEREFRSLAENASDNIGRWGPDRRVLYVNPAFASLFGEPAAALVGRSADDLAPSRFADVAAALDDVLARDAPVVVEQRFIEADGGERVLEVRLVPEHDDDGRLSSVLGIGRDITDVVRHREALERLARTDALTGVANRQLLYERSPGLLDEVRARGGKVGVMLLDLDDFKLVNDRLGHRAGDDLLRAVAGRLSSCIREGDLLVRLGGDEFVVVTPGIDSRAAMSALADRVRLALTEISAIDGVRIARVHASVGIVLFPDDGDTMDTLLARADLAMYEAKHHGRGRVEHFRDELSTTMERRAAIEHALVVGDLDREFELHLQPVYSLGGVPRIVGAEALARWNHPELGPVSPDEFIPVAEESGRIVQLGRWVLRRACQLAVRCNAGRVSSGRAPVSIAVNVSTRQFALDDVARSLRLALDETGCDPAWLGLEITESLLLEDSPSVQRALETVRGLGVTIAIDDFGMGYSALHYLARFQFDRLKIDRRFVDGIGSPDRRGELVGAFVALARALDLDVIAEGIETDVQLRYVTGLGCEFGQGYLLARPMPPDEFEALVRLGEGIVADR